MWRKSKKQVDSQTVANKATRLHQGCDDTQWMNAVYRMIRIMERRTADLEERVSTLRRDLSRIDRKVYRRDDLHVSDIEAKASANAQLALQRLGFLGGPHAPVS